MARKTLLTEGEVRQFMKLASLGGLTETYLSNTTLDEVDEEELESELHATEDELGAEDHIADEEGDELDAMDAEGGEDNEALLARVVQAVAAELGVEVDVEGADAEGGEEELEVDAELEEPLPGGEELEMGAEEEVELPGGRDMYEEGDTGASAGDESKTHPGEEDYTTKKREKKKTSSPGRGEKKGDEAYINEAEPAQQHDAGDEGADEEEELRRARERNQAAKDRQRGRDRRGVGIKGITREGALDHDEVVEEVARRVAERLNAERQQEEVASQLAERIFNRLTAK